MTKGEMIARIEGFADVREEASNEFSDLVKQLWTVAYRDGHCEGYEEGFDSGYLEGWDVATHGLYMVCKGGKI